MIVGNIIYGYAIVISINITKNIKNAIDFNGGIRLYG